MKYLSVWTENCIGVEGVRMISAALKQNRTLTELNLMGNAIYIHIYTPI